MRRIIFLLTFAATIYHSYPITITTYSSAENDRFATFSLTAMSGLLPNTSPSFAGAGLNLTGWGYRPVIGDGSRIPMYGLLSERHFLYAVHYTPPNNVPIHFVNNSGDVVLREIIQRTPATIPSFSTSSTPTHDVGVGLIDRGYGSETGITPFRILDVSSGNYNNLDLILTGSGNTVATRKPQAVWAKISGDSTSPNAVYTVTTNPSKTTQTFTLNLGDSGSPSFTVHNNEATLMGANWFGSGAGSHVTYAGLDNTPSYDPVTAVSNQMAIEGFALRFQVYNATGPIDPINGPNRWTGGAANGNWGNTSNWSAAALPGNRPIVFNADTASSQTTIDLQANRTVRGIAFAPSTTSAGFTFTPGYTLTVGHTGIINEDNDTQTFNTAITLGGHQTWQARAGDMNFNGPINNAGNLLMLDTHTGRQITLSGTLSGTGGLAKAGPGLAVLAGAHTYTGATWVHDGTLRLAPGASLASNLLRTQTGANAVFDLNGNNHTLGGWIGNHGTTKLGGATLTLTSGTFTSTGTVDLQNGLVLLTNAAATTYPMLLSGTGTVRAINGAAATLATPTGWNGDLYMGNTSGAAGRVIFQQPASLPTGEIIFDSTSSTWGNHLQLNGTGTWNVTNPIQLRRPNVASQNIQISTLHAGANYTFSGNITTNTINGTQNINTLQFRTGNNTIALTGNNDFTGLNRLELAQPGAAHQTRFEFSANALNNLTQLSLADYSTTTGARFDVRATDPGTYAIPTTVFGGSAAGRSNVVASFGGAHTTGTVTFANPFDISWSSFDTANGTLELVSENAGTRTNFTGLINDGANSRPVRIAGNGTVALARPTGNTYDGGTTVAAGATLLANNTSGSATGTGTVNVNGTLGGTGFISGAVNILTGGTLSPGDGIGLLTTGALNLSSGSSILMQLAGVTTRGTTYDAMNVNGALTYGGNLNLDFTTIPNVGDVFNLFDFTSASGTFASINILTPGITGTFNYTTGEFLITAIPEPTALLGALLLLITCLALRKRATERP